MDYRLLGKTGLAVSFLGLGGLPLQRIPEKEAVRIVELCLDRGLNFIDTARSYGDSEQKIGKAVSGRRDKVVLASKSRVTSYQEMRQEIERSLAAFATDYLDLYQCHNINTKDRLEQIMAPGGALEALTDAKKEGKIRAIGFSGHRLGLALEAVRCGCFETVQVPFNFIERAAQEELFPLARRLNLGTIVMKPLAGGAFSRPDLAMRFLADKEVSVLIPGMDQTEQVEENYALVRERKPLNEEEVAYLTREAEVIGDRFCRRCEYCNPCPQGIDITACIASYGYYHRYGMKEWACELYAKMAVKADACVRCGLCETRCPYSLPIREILLKAHQDLGQR